MTKKIAVIDSGIGGTSLVDVMIKRNLEVELYYQADSVNVPYGGKDQEFMYNRMLKMIQQFLDFDAIFLACNTLTAETIDRLRQNVRIPFFGIEPYVNFLNKSTPGKMALILTPATYQSDRFRKLREKFDPESRIDIFPLKHLAQIIEDYRKISWGAVSSELAPLREKNYDYLILGCTHYSLIRGFIEKELDVQTVDPCEEVVDHIKNQLKLQRGQAHCVYKFNLDDQEFVHLDLPLVREKWNI